MNYITQLTILRFLAAILVVIFHFGKETWPFNLNSISSIINQGSIAVSFFFFLSGVVLALNYMSKTEFSNREFFIKRFARLYPVYLIAFIVTLILGMIFNDAFPKGRSVLLQLFTLHAWSPGTCLEINYPSWSISVEVFFYILFPLILLLEKRIGNVKTTIFIISFWFLSAIQHYLFSELLYVPKNAKIGQFILYFPLWHLNTFLIGILCAKYIRIRKRVKSKNFLQPRILFTLGIITFFAIIGTDNIIKPYTHNGLMAPVFFLIVAGLATDKSLITKFIGNKTFILLGNASYSIYLFQWPIYICLCTLLGLDQLHGAYFYIYLLCLVLISVTIYIGFEKKMKKLLVSKWIKTVHNKN